ncbi:MAG TPA: DUF523 and DUF1722 domain-containing protein [Acidiferrobacterales bacterium]|nr:DUF523 and DUF1722 domain-containing protein [Acidiferrobacterales bacterium]
MSARIRIGISSCLLGQAVRFDGGHKHNGYITESLGQFFDFVPYCPEVAIGLGIPRPPIRLVNSAHGPRARGVEDATLDVTDKLVAYAEKVAPKLHDLSGYILKQGSPSCGMERVKVYGPHGRPVATGAGLYAGTLMAQRPELPFEEEGRLMDPVLRENFVECVFVYHRWQQLTTQRLTAKALVEFHTRHKFIVLAHDEKRYRELGRLVATAGRRGMAGLGRRYIQLLMQALKKPATRTRHANVLQHLFGFLKQNLDAADKRELLEFINSYRRGQLPLVVPITLLRHYLRRFPVPYLSEQFYLALHPDEIMLRYQI